MWKLFIIKKSSYEQAKESTVNVKLIRNNSLFCEGGR